MAPVFVDSFGRIHQQTPKGAFIAGQYASDSPTLFSVSAFPNNDGVASCGGNGMSIPLQAQSFTPRYQTPMYDPNFQLSMSAPVRMPTYSEYMAPMMAMPVPQQFNGAAGHPGLFRVSSAAPMTTSASLEPASGPQRSISARPALETPSHRRRSSPAKDETKKSAPAKVKPTGVAFPAYVDRVKVPDEWKSIYESGNDLPSGFSRPPYDYAGLIGRILLEGGGAPKRMTVAELFYALINKYPFYMAHPRLLYNGLRHNLTGCDALMKADRQWGDQASSRYWTIKPGCESCFGTGYYVRESAKNGAKAKKAAAMAEAELANPNDDVSSTPAADGSDDVTTANKPKIVPYSANPNTSRRSSTKKTPTSPPLASIENALKLTGLPESARQPFSNKTNSSNSKSGGSSALLSIDVEEYNKKAAFRQRHSKKSSGINSKNVKAGPYCVTLPMPQSGMAFSTATNFGNSIPPPLTLQYGTSENYIPEMRPMPLNYPVLDRNSVPETAGNLSSLSGLAISTEDVHVRSSHVSESSASESEMTSPGDSSLASAMDFTLVRRRSQEELQAAMEQR
jgi:hypothetical protein